MTRPKAPARKRSAAIPPPTPSPGPEAVASSRLKVVPAWPLPVPDYFVPLLDRRGGYDAGPRPHLEVLLEMAIAAKEPDEVLRWFDKMRRAETGPGYYNHALTYADRVAEAVATARPERAIEIYQAALNGQLPRAEFSAYEAAAGYLKKLRPIFKALGRSGEWDALLASIRDRYRNRPRFMEILDRLDGRTILDSARPKRK